MSERKYQLTVGQLIDELQISLMKSVFIERQMYRTKMNLIKDDLKELLVDVPPVPLIYAVSVLMLSNFFIWKNEGDIRTTPMTEGKPDGYREIAQRLIATHAINGVRNRAKNEISKIVGERWDAKEDCLAADLPPTFSNWRVFDDG